MKKQVKVYYSFGELSHKPACQIEDPDTKEVFAFCIRDSWIDAETAAILEAERYLKAGLPPCAKTIEIEAPDPEPIELMEVVEK